MKKTNNSIFTRVLALLLCLIMFAGVMTACFRDTEINEGVGSTTSGDNTTKPSTTTKPTTGTTTGDSAGKDPEEDPVDPNEIYSASTTISADSLIYGALANDVVIGGNEGVTALVPADVKIESGASSLALSIKNVEEGTEIDGEALSNLDVHISGIAADNAVPMTVMLGAILPIGLDNTEFKLYHIDDGTPVLMTRVNSAADFAIHNQYVYNAETGVVTIYVSSFSVFTAVQTTVSKWEDDTEADTSWYDENATEFTLEDVADFLGFRDLVDAGNTFEGKTVILGVDIDLSDKPFDPIGFGYYDNSKRTETDGEVTDNNTVFLGTFDGAGHTIYNLYENCWELDPDKTNYSTYTYSTAGAGLFASIKDATIKNLAISGAEIVFECVDMGVVVGYAQGTCHFENIVVTDSNIANYNRYTGGLVGEVSYGPYGLDTSLGYSHTFKNITIDSSVTVSGLWGSFGCGMGGVIGGKWGDATVLMENVVSAPVMDVYNDVVSAYQWYAFRGCGMLIGHTEEPYSDGRHSGNATASFLTCENVKVYYGDWVNYHYYEFENQDNGTGQRYPWVRAEAGEYCDAFSNIRYGVPTHNGVKVSDLTEEELKAIATDYTPIVFNQLYGADRGMYGTAEHDGVTVDYKNTKTIYIKNTLGWENMKLHYWHKHGDDTWTNIDTNGIALTEENGVYKVVLPAYAFGFRITSDGDNVTRDFYLSEVTEDETYNLDFEHVHYFATNKCDCGAYKQELEHQFTLGENGEAKHSDGSAASEYTETVDDCTLTLSGISSVYHNARDEIGNSCIKLGTGSNTGRFSFTAPENVEKVIIYVAGYKANNAKISINGVEYEITTHSNDGEYTAIEIDTTETKTVSFTTVDHMGESRCMIDTISFVTTRVVEVHECDENEEIPAVAPTCTEAGLTAGKACSLCGKVMVAQETVDPTGHTEEIIPAEDATCTKNGLTQGIRCSVCDEILVEQETVISSGHSYSAGKCIICGEDFPQTSGTYTYVFNDYTEGTQYAENEEHILDEYVTMFTTQCYFTSELRIYSSSTYNGYAIIKSVNPISQIKVNAGNLADKINIYGSDDGINWTTEPIATISVTSTSYKDYTVEFEIEYKWLKLDVEGGNQVRLKSMTLTTVPDCAHASTITETVEPTCTEAGYTVEKCSVCGKEMSRTNEVAPTGHSYNSEVTTNATCTTAGLMTYTCATCQDSYTEEIAATGHTFVDGKCSACGEPESETSTDPTWTLVTDINDLKAGDKIIIVAKDYNYALSTTQNNNNRGQATVDKKDDTITFGNDVQIIVLESGKVSGTFAFNTGSGYLYAASSSSNYLRTENTLSNNSSWKITIADGTATIVAQGTYTRNTMQYNQSSSLFACYASASQKAIVIYKLEGGSTGDEPSCEHTNTTTTTIDATCTEAGSVTVTCDACGEILSTEEIEVTGHNYVGGTCSVCGATRGDTTETTTENLNVYGTTGAMNGTTSISWTSENVTLTNTKGSTAIRTSDSDHYRVYANSTVTISANGGKITQVVITCTSSSYATVMQTSVTNAGYIATVDGSVVTITVSDADSITFTASAQTRINKVEVTYTK